MSIETTDTLVVGAGQAGVAMSEHLTQHGIPHIVLEKSRIAERWRTGRWDSLVANGPAWHDRFPNMEYSETSPEAFPPKEQVADYFEAYAKRFDAPIRTGVEVTSVTRLKARPGFRVETSEGVIEAQRVVAATGPFQKPLIPQIVPDEAGMFQIHSHDYRNPEQLPEGAVLVVGGGSSGSQIADELLRSGRKTYLSVGPHGRPPRSYRGRDFCWWLGVLGKWELEAPVPGTEHITIAVSGAYGGTTIDFREMGQRGMTLLGITERYEDGVLHIADDLRANIARGDSDLNAVLDEADAYAERMGLDLPPEPALRRPPPDPDCVTNPVRRLDVTEAGITSIIWATGFGLDYSWLKVDAFDEAGKPQHQRGVSSERGVYFLGLPWLSRRGSSFIWGVWHDAKHIADQIAIQRNYSDHHVRALGQTTDA